eukprot:6201357-Pleurochrysis_carterae.AAC.1
MIGAVHVLTRVLALARVPQVPFEALARYEKLLDEAVRLETPYADEVEIFDNDVEDARLTKSNASIVHDPLDDVTAIWWWGTSASHPAKSCAVPENERGEPSHR